ncbi:MAG: GNAT family N-acetyltransferase [Lentisphaerae bacterium RIFOXYA12_FULL_48_11]|nr:MAG: GNAT family N-acetyltransferase [Lentisphaerae bacterium RIFOXYA12_FULL_48_11]
MIRRCLVTDAAEVVEIVNDAARAYCGVIEADCWKEPYMPLEELLHEIEDGVQFYGWEDSDRLVGVMGIQDKGDVALIRHAYVRTVLRKHGIGGKLLKYLQDMTSLPILIGTWSTATWAISFYEKHGYRLVSWNEKERLLREYWSISERQVDTSVVLADNKWFNSQKGEIA